ncbi:MAG: SpoIIE family protein phosphatase [Oceanospirillum sp.]|nr:SpoIIE family protein phosphatase [Oceanospirillum sp.]
MLTTLMDAVYVSGSSTEGPLCTALCESLEAEPLPLIESPAELPDATKLVIFEIRQPDDLFAIEDWLISSREYALVVIGSDEHAEPLIKALEAGADDYLLNPEQNIALTVLVLKRAVSRKQELLQSQQTYDELEQLNLELMTSLDLLRQDQQAGRYVQQKMLPDSPWAFQQQDFSYMICPSLYLSGDFVDYFPINDHQVMFYLADVSGHGASSAFITILLRVYIRRYVKRALRLGEPVNPADILQRVNSELLETSLGKHLTIFLGLLDSESRQLRYCNGAHFPYPVLVDEEQGARYLEGKGMPVGLFADATYEEFELLLHPRYHLTLFSDGVFEVINETSLAAKEKRLLEIATQFAGQHDAMVNHFTELGMQDAPDDVSLLAVSGS